jgi:inner membrane protein
MLALGHIGITLGIGLVGNKLLLRQAEKSQITSAATKGPVSERISLQLDLRYWMVGSILPDAIDKPLGIYLFPGFFGDNGRIMSHTIVFAALVLLLGFFIYRKYEKLWLLPIGLGVVTHLIFDEMWRSPQTLFWPLLGFNFPAYPESDWLGSIFEAYLSSPSAYIPEIIGGLVILGFAWYLLAKRRARVFLRLGNYLAGPLA